MAFARVNGIVLHHDVRGRESAPALVFSNPLGTDFRIRDVEQPAETARPIGAFLDDAGWR